MPTSRVDIGLTTTTASPLTNEEARRVAEEAVQMVDGLAAVVGSI
jgi:hypothetical protein